MYLCIFYQHILFISSEWPVFAKDLVVRIHNKYIENKYLSCCFFYRSKIVLYIIFSVEYYIVEWFVVIKSESFSPPLCTHRLNWAGRTSQEW